MDVVDQDPEVSLLFSTGRNLASQSDVNIYFSRDLYSRRPLPEELEIDIEKIWKERCKLNTKIWNGTKFRLDSHSFKKDSKITLCIGLTCYKEFLGTNFSPKALRLQQLGMELHQNRQAFMSDPLGVGSLLLTSDGCSLILKRSIHCAEAPGLYDIPGGHPEPEEVAGYKFSLDDKVVWESFTREAILEEIFLSIKKEIRDEVNIPIEYLSEPLLMGIAVNNTSHGRASAEFLVRTSLTSEQVVARYQNGTQAEADESTSIRVLKPEELDAIRSSILWKELAPSAKGCFMLYELYIREKTPEDKEK